MKKLLTLVATAGLAFTAAAPALAEVNEVTPSTNEINQEKGWAHFVVEDVRIGEADITFVQPRSFAACFEVRIDGEDPTSADNFNPGDRPMACGPSSASPVDRAPRRSRLTRRSRSAWCSEPRATSASTGPP